MNTNKRTKSIARRINRHSVFQMLSAFLAVDLLFIIFATALWCYSVEKTGNTSSKINGIRYFTTITRLEEEQILAQYETASENAKAFFLPIMPVKNFLSSIVYVWEDQQKDKQYAYAGSFLIGLFCCLSSMCVVELLAVLYPALTGTRNIRRQLAPLDELAFKAEILANTANLGQQALEELEQAINTISPTKEGTRLHTGNAEMETLEHAINSLLDRMRESYRQQSRFVSDASHELRTPISVLQGYVNMLDRWGKEDENILDEAIEAIKGETEHMKKLIEQLLFLAKGDSGRIKLNMTHFSLNNMLREVCEESAMIDTNHRYMFSPWKEDLIIAGDESMLKQTARILIDNAAKYAPSDSFITLKTILTTKNGSINDPVNSSRELPAFLIQDEGIGISGEDASHMFDRFYRSDPARNKDNGGTGLGLSIAKWIVDRHGGSFHVLSREDIGTRITVLLPARSLPSPSCAESPYTS